MAAVSREFRVSWWDRLLIGIAPDWGMRRLRARAMARHYDAASTGRRTSGWQRHSSDANTAAVSSLTSLRELSRDLRRNNGWARRAVQVIANNAISWGIKPKPRPGKERRQNARAIALWNDWADSTACDYDGLLNFYGLQRLALMTVVEAGEVLIVRQPGTSDMAIPLRLQVLDPDYLDTNKHGIRTSDGNKIIGGVEFDSVGRRVAYWLFTSHPGSNGLLTRQFDSVRVPADRVIHMYEVERPGQVRGIPWLCAAIARLNDLDDFEDAEMMQQKVAACFGAFVTDESGDDETALGEEDEEDESLENIEPGSIAYLSAGQKVTFAQPPRAQDGSFSVRSLRRIAVSVGIPYEEMTGDYSLVNFSSARMARIAFWQNVSAWREHMVIPQFCGGVWRWAMELAAGLEDWKKLPVAQWSGPPLPILEPDKEGLAYLRLVRIGAMTWQQMVSELGYDPTEQLAEIAAFNKMLDAAGIVLDVDPRKMTAGGQYQSLPAADAADDGVEEEDAGDAQDVAPSNDDDEEEARSARRSFAS